jgi:hypothetical protein
LKQALASGAMLSLDFPTRKAERDTLRSEWDVSGPRDLDALDHDKVFRRSLRTSAAVSAVHAPSEPL